MTVNELKAILKKFKGTDEVLVWDEETSRLSSICSACRNGSSIQLNVEDEIDFATIGYVLS